MNASATQPEIRDQLLLRLAESRSLSDDLFGMVRADALYDRPIPERHRIVFYIGHLEAFDWNLIAGHALGLEPMTCLGWCAPTRYMTGPFLKGTGLSFTSAISRHSTGI